MIISHYYYFSYIQYFLVNVHSELWSNIRIVVVQIMLSRDKVLVSVHCELRSNIMNHSSSSNYAIN
jgi:hypothetical protein